MTRMAIVPAEPDAAMYEAGYDQPFPIIEDIWPAMLAASPGSGRITAEMVERAANAIAIRRGWGPFTLPLGDYIEGSKIGQCVADARAALTAIGLQIEGDGLAEGEAR